MEKLPPDEIDACFTRQGRERERKAMARAHRCGQCGASLGNPYLPDLGEIGLVCSQDRSHTGFERIPSMYERFRRGEAMDLATANAIEHGMAKRRKRKEETR